jgi:hypothetical protein
MSEVRPLSSSMRSATEGASSAIGGANAVRSAVASYRRGEITNQEALRQGLEGGSQVAGSISDTQAAFNSLQDHNAGNRMGYAGELMGVVSGGIGMNQGRQAMNAARPAVDGSARDAQFTSGLGTTLRSAGEATSNLRRVSERATVAANLGNTPTALMSRELRTPELGAGISDGANASRVTRGTQVTNGLRVAGGLINVASGLNQMYSGYQESCAPGRAGETNLEQERRQVDGRRGMFSGGLAVAGGIASAANYTPAGQVITAARTGFEIGSEGDRLSGERGPIRDRNGERMRVSEWAGDDAAEVRAREGSFAGARALVGNTIVAGAVATGNYVQDRADRAADTASRVMGLEGPSTMELIARAEAEERLEAQARGQRTPPNPDAAQERRVQAAMARIRAQRQAEERQRAAATPAAAPVGFPTERAADVRPGQVDAAGRRLVPRDVVRINPQTGMPWRSDAEREMYEMMQGRGL